MTVSDKDVRSALREILVASHADKWSYAKTIDRIMLDVFSTTKNKHSDVVNALTAYMTATENTTYPNGHPIFEAAEKAKDALQRIAQED